MAVCTLDEAVPMVRTMGTVLPVAMPAGSVALTCKHSGKAGCQAREIDGSWLASDSQRRIGHVDERVRKFPIRRGGGKNAAAGRVDDNYAARCSRVGRAVDRQVLIEHGSLLWGRTGRVSDDEDSRLRLNYWHAEGCGSLTVGRDRDGGVLAYRNLKGNHHIELRCAGV